MPIKITIPEPCSENWNEMTPTQKGAFCASCQKEVIDFRAHSQMELARKIEANSKNGDSHGLCGRFRPEQLNTSLPRLNRNRWRNGAVAAGFTALLLGSCSTEDDIFPRGEGVEFQESIEVIEVNVGEVKTPLDSLQPPPHVEITGTVVDPEGRPLPGAYIRLIGTKLNVEADPNGAFTIQFSPELRESEVWLEVIYIGFDTMRLKISPDLPNTLLLKLKVSEDVLGGIAVIESTNILHRIGNLIRKHC